MGRESKEMSKEFIEYQEFIVNHPHYKGFPITRNSDGSLRWVVSGKSDIGQQRIEWLDKKRMELGIPKNLGWRTEVCYAIHPLKKKPCQICGRVMSLDYIYLNERIATKLNEQLNIPVAFSNCSDIHDVVREIINYLGNKGYFVLSKYFKVPDTIPNTIPEYTKYILSIGKQKKLLGPGAMGNPPDRADGFHSYNRCCRGTSDKGRHKENLKRYGDDRRAYENWSDGNWKAANRLMKEFNKYGVSADHIGPISLGFCHRPRFQPMTIQEQSIKNNRMSFADVNLLISDEKKGQEVVSWHSKPLWDKLKYIITNDYEAKIASDYMRKNLHFILSSLAYLHMNDCDDFLIKKILSKNLIYSFYDYSFDGFDSTTGLYKYMHSKELTGKNQQNNVTRYIRVAFESLEKYIDKKNRKIKDDEIFDPVLPILDKVIMEIKSSNYDSAYELLNKAFTIKADIFKASYQAQITNRIYQYEY